MEWLKLDLPDADLRIAPEFLAVDEADHLFAHLLDEIAWEVHRLKIHGRVVESPRRCSWIGDAAAIYTYSGSRFAPHAWTPTLLDLKSRAEIACDYAFNSVLANWYRDGRDAMGWHADNEPELGPEPLIASVSLGAERVMRFRRGRCGPSQGWLLPHGSLLIMAGTTQTHYQHAIPRTTRPLGGRINLTFRQIHRSTPVAPG
jgi:alkylated DNA repair dioxygenase AlkB